MRKLYKDGKECVADDEQIADMLKADWSFDKTAPVKDSEPEAEAKTESEVEAPIKKIPKRKVIKKSTPTTED